MRKHGDSWVGRVRLNLLAAAAVGRLLWRLWRPARLTRSG
jgi:hypothetical protein